MIPSIEAYFDESGSHHGAKALCVAGYVLEKSQAQLLAQEWTTELEKWQLPYFHMVDCAHRAGPFANLSPTQCIQVEAHMIGIIKRRAACGFAESVDVAAYDELVPPEFRIAGSAYSFCVRNVLDAIGGWLHLGSFRGESRYFFEAGHASRSEADQVIGRLFVNPLIDHVYHHGYAGHAFVGKREAPAVQAADLLAWQWATDVRHAAEQRPRRKDFDSLMQGGFRGHHFSRESLPKYVDLLRRFEVDKDHDAESIERSVERILSIQKEWRSAIVQGFTP